MNQNVQDGKETKRDVAEVRREVVPVAVCDNGAR